MEVIHISLDDNLDQLVADINGASWDSANDISANDYDADSLKAYLNKQDTIFLACYELADGKRTLAGIASSRIEIKPYGKEQWLYVDEVDVCTDQRKKGAGTLMMRKLLEIAESTGCEELWLGTEADNTAANALYQSLGPEEVLTFIGYTYDTDK